MTKDQEQAFKIVDEVCSGFRGNRKDHVTIQTALQVIFTALNPMMEVEVPKEDEKKEEVEEE